MTYDIFSIHATQLDKQKIKEVMNAIFEDAGNLKTKEWIDKLNKDELKYTIEEWAKLFLMIKNELEI